MRLGLGGMRGRSGMERLVAITYDVIADEGMELTTDGTVESGNIGVQAVGPATVALANLLIPTVGEWGMIILVLLLATTSLVVIRRRSVSRE